jgi:manganese/zinc/iron transport system permease protein
LAVGSHTHAGGVSITDVTDDWPTLSEVFETLTFRSGYNTNLVIVGTTLLGVAAGIVGVFALLRKRSLVTDAASHATLPGIVLAFLAAGSLGVTGRALPVLLLGAAATGVLGVVCIQLILRYSRLREDASIGIVLSVFFGAGVVGLSYVQVNAPTGAAGLNTFIYGQAAAMQPADIALMGGIAGVALLAAVLFLKEFALVCFNDAFARVDGWPVGLIDLVMMALAVLVTVAGLQAVGLILVVAMLIIPAVAARLWTERLWRLVLIAAVIGAVSGYAGSVVSAILPRKPAGAVVVLTCGVIFTFSLFAAPSRGIAASAIRRLRLRFSIAGDHLLELGHEQNEPVVRRETLSTLARARGWSPLFRACVLLALRRAGMVEPTRAGVVRVTARGMLRGAQVHRNHALWEQYLISYADVAPSHVDWSVDQVEHVLSGDLVDELERELTDRGITVADRSAKPA